MWYKRRLLIDFLKWAIITGAVLGSAVWIVGSSKTFKYCIQEAKTEAGDQRPKKGIRKLTFDATIHWDCTGEFLHKNGDAVTAAFTIVLAISTIALWLATKQLYEAGERQLDHAKEVSARQARDTEASIEVAKLQADAAMLSAQEAAKARHNLELQLRANVIKTLAEIRNLGIGLIPQAHVVVENTGQTPAYQVTSRLGIAFLPFPPPKPPAFPSDPHQSVTFVGTGKELHLTAFLADSLRKEHFTVMESEQWAIHVIGCVEYRDAFGQLRSTRFSMFYGGKYGMNENCVLVNGPDGNEAT